MDGAVVGKCGLGGVAEVGGGKAKVFGGTAQADKEFAVVGIYGGQAAGEIGGERDMVFAVNREQPRLGIMP